MINRLRHRINKSFSARFSLYIILLVGAVFIITFAVSYHYSYKTIENSARKNAEGLLNNTTLEIESLLVRMEKVVDNLKTVVEKGEISTDSLYSLVADVVKNNDEVIGSAIAFEPGYFKSKGYYFSPFAYRNGEEILTKQLGSPEYDYFIMEWYQIPKLLNRNYWTEPYYDEGGADVIMCTYSSIMSDKNGKFIGVFTIDISLSWLSDLVANLKPYENSYSFVIGNGGTYIVHRQANRILNESIFSISYQEPDPGISRRIGQKMVDGETGEEVIINDGYVAYVFYAPISNTGWSLAMVCPKDDVFVDLKFMNRILAGIAIGGLLLIFIFCARIIKNVTLPLKSFSTSAKQIAQGDFNVILPKIKSEDEMLELHDSFEYMQKELVHYINSLESTVSAKEKIESELRIARQIQLGMIPKTFPAFPSRSDLDIYAILYPAKEVGGDLYDFYIDDDKLYFIVGDVSGKGVPASLLMAVTRSLFRSISAYLKSPANIVSSLSSAIAESNDSNMFVTLFLAILDLKTGEINYCNAGHNPPVLLYNNEVSFFPVNPNIPIGLFNEFPYTEQKGYIPSGATLFCYTDGLTEAENETKKLYGDERMLKILQGKEQYTCKEQINTILEDIALHVGDAEQSDDLTILTISTFSSQIGRKIVFMNELSEIGKLREIINSVCKQMELPSDLSMNLQLVLEEAATNVILYAYNGEKGEIELNISKSGNRLEFIMSDSGVPFNPLKIEDPDVISDVEERPVGGLGIFLIKQLMDEVDYVRLNGKNILTIKKIIKI